MDNKVIAIVVGIVLFGIVLYFIFRNNKPVVKDLNCTCKCECVEIEKNQKNK